MKTQISRHSDQPARHYTGVYQQQGRMLVDADANEQMEIVKRRLGEAIGDIVSAGAPRYHGVVDVTQTPPRLAYGHVYVDGLHSRVAPGPGGTGDVYLDQADFPSPPARPDAPYLYYIDLWERPVLALEDAELVDPALNGADTCARTLAMAQLKCCPATADPLSLALNPPAGDAVLQADVREDAGAARPDPCDVCAVEIDPGARVGNYVFRLEVHDVQGPANAPERIVLKWSSENAAEAHAIDDLPPDFEEEGSVYEHYDAVADSHLGVHLVPGFTPTRGLLTAELHAGAGPFVRRWDGALELRRADAGWTLAPEIRQHEDVGLAAVDWGIPLAVSGTRQIGAVEVGDALRVDLRRLTLNLQLKDRVFVAGDHWLVTVRERAEAARRARVVTPRPLGIIHHVLLLGEADGEQGIKLDPDARRRLSFPSLTDIRAGDVGIRAPASDLFEGAKTVQEAFDRLPGLHARDVAFSDPDCSSGLLRYASTVEGALEAICGIQAEHVGYAADPAAAKLAGATTVQSALDTLGKQAASDSGVCDAVLALFGRGVLSGLVPTVGAFRDAQGELRVSASCSAGTFINGRGCLARVNPLSTDFKPGPNPVMVVGGGFGSRFGGPPLPGGLVSLGPPGDRPAAGPLPSGPAAPAASPDLWLYVVDPPDGEAHLEIRDAAPDWLFAKGWLPRIQEAVLDGGSGPAVGADVNAETAYAQAWGLFQDVSEVEPRADGAVCLGRIGLAGDIAWVGPDDREQLFPTPAHTTTLWRRQRKRVQTELRAAYTAGEPTLMPLERTDGTPLHGSSAMADGSAYAGVVRLAGLARGGDVTVALSAPAGIVVPPSVTIAQGQTSAAFEYSLTKGQPGAHTITATLAGQSSQTAQITGVGLAMPEVLAQPVVSGSQPISQVLAGVTTTLRIGLTGPAPHRVEVEVALEAGLFLTPNNGTGRTLRMSMGPGQQSATLQMRPLSATVGDRTVTATAGQLTTTKTVTVRALNELKRVSDGGLLNESRLTVGGPYSGRVELTGPADIDAELVLSSDAGVTVPATVKIPKGDTSATFAIGAITVSPTPKNIWVTLADQLRQARVYVDALQLPGTYEINPSAVYTIREQTFKEHVELNLPPGITPGIPGNPMTGGPGGGGPPGPIPPFGTGPGGIG